MQKKNHQVTQDQTSFLERVKIVVVKIGTRVLTARDGTVDVNRISHLIDQVQLLFKKEVKVVLVTSGAITAGTVEMGLQDRPKTLPEQQAAAAVGQSVLMELYHNQFKNKGMMVAQVLVTADDLKDRKRHLNARNTLLSLINRGIIPIINENDTVSVDEIKFGDNDRLSALVCNLVRAELLIMLSDIDGLMTSDPRKGKESQLINRVDEITPEIEKIAGRSSSFCGTGGMSTKLDAAKIAVRSGVSVIICNGMKDNSITDIFLGKKRGTLFLAKKSTLTAKKRWIAFFVKPKGELIVDEGARDALRDRGRSLLSSGITQIKGTFEIGDTVRILDIGGTEFARGLVNYSSTDVHKIRGIKTSEIETVLGYKFYDEVIHRDNLVLL
ncbi:glutamate 5-kinase [Chlamydiota bacterium]